MVKLLVFQEKLDCDSPWYEETVFKEQALL